jgi:hypothetical protein
MHSPLEGLLKYDYLVHELVELVPLGEIEP